jgi:hypothetical protein
VGILCSHLYAKWVGTVVTTQVQLLLGQWLSFCIWVYQIAMIAYLVNIVFSCLSDGSHLAVIC